MENQDLADATKIYKIRKTILQMLFDRGYVIEQKLLDEPLKVFQEKFKGRDSLKPIGAQKKDNESDKILVEFFKNSKNDKKIGVKDIQSFTSKLNHEYIPKGIMIINCPITSLAKQLISEVDDLIHLEYFEERELIVNITEHELVPKHNILSDEEKKTLLARYKLKENQLPKILLTDPVAKYLGLRKGQVVKIIRNSETAGRYVTYRVAV